MWGLKGALYIIPPSSQNEEHFDRFMVIKIISMSLFIFISTSIFSFLSCYRLCKVDSISQFLGSFIRFVYRIHSHFPCIFINGVIFFYFVHSTKLIVYFSCSILCLTVWKSQSWSPRYHHVVIFPCYWGTQIWLGKEAGTS